MSSKLFYLSSAGLKNLVFKEQESEYDFSFIFGQRIIKTNKYYAEFISPVISHLHQCDPTITSVSLEDIISTMSKSTINNIQNYFTDQSISQFEEILQGESVEIDISNRKSLLFLSIALGNEEMFDRICESSTSDPSNKSVEELLDELEVYEEFSIKEFKYSTIIDRLSTEFSKIDKKRLETVSPKLLYLIISNPHFQSEDEDSLFDIISRNQSRDESESIELLEEIDLKKLSPTKFREFIEDFDYRGMTDKIWAHICECLYINHQGNMNTKEDKVNSNERTFEFNGNPFHGIIYQLTSEAGGNVSDKGIVDITSSSYDGWNLPKNAADFDSTNYFYSDFDTYKQWIQFDFKKRRVRPSGYSIKTWHTSNGNPQNWCLEVSNTGSEGDWKIVDCRANVVSIQNANSVDTFEINPEIPSNESYRYVRLRQTEHSSSMCNNLIISALEFFGKLIE